MTSQISLSSQSSMGSFFQKRATHIAISVALAAVSAVAAYFIIQRGVSCLGSAATRGQGIGAVVILGCGAAYGVASVANLVYGAYLAKTKDQTFEQEPIKHIAFHILSTAAAPVVGSILAASSGCCIVVV